MAKEAVDTLSKISTTFLYTVLGFIVLQVVIFYLVIISPILIYRYILTKWIAPHYFLDSNLGNALTPNVHLLATEFHKDFSHVPSRCPIIVNIIIPGIVTKKEMVESLTKGWLQRKSEVKGEEDKLHYPEFQQYIENWMGYMFFKNDTSFSLDNHLFVHSIRENATEMECDKIMCNCVETLINKTFPAKRSPWELHMFHGYKNSKLGQGNMTLFVFRFHHAMMDGFSIMYALIEGLAGGKLPDVKIATPNEVKRSGMEKWVYFPLRMISDLGYFATRLWEQIRVGQNNPFHLPDEKKKWKQLYARSELIPIEKIKRIKNEFGASFTGVLLSSLAAGVAQSFTKKGNEGNFPNSFPVATLIPLKNHPKTLRNHVTLTFLDFIVTPNLSPLDRLQKVEESFQSARHDSQLPVILWLYTQIMGLPFATMSRFLTKNRLISSAFTNFPGPGTHIKFMGKNCEAVDFCVGGLIGIAGVVFATVSYKDHIRLTITAENGCMERTELETLMKDISKEIDKLYNEAIGKYVLTTDSFNGNGNSSKVYNKYKDH